MMPPSRRDRIRCSDDRGHDRGDDRHAGADAEIAYRGAAEIAADAAELFRLVKARTDARGGCWHLSALMCPQHRSDTIGRIKAERPETDALVLDHGGAFLLPGFPPAGFDGHSVMWA